MAFSTISSQLSEILAIGNMAHINRALTKFLSLILIAIIDIASGGK